MLFTYLSKTFQKKIIIIFYLFASISFKVCKYGWIFYFKAVSSSKSDLLYIGATRCIYAKLVTK